MTERPTMDDVLREMATLMSRRSTCSRGAVGAIAALDGRVVVSGYNGAPTDIDHCEHKVWLATPDTVPPPDWVQQHLPYGMIIQPGDGARLDSGEFTLIRRDQTDTTPSCKVSVHAEANLIAFSAKHGIALLNTTIYTTYSPCVECAKLLINCGVIRVIALRAYRDLMGIALLQRAGIAVVTA